MSSERLFLILLQKILGCSNYRTVKLLKYFGTAEKIFFAGRNALKNSGILTDLGINKILNADISIAEKIERQCVDNGIKYIAYNDSDYPIYLKEIHNPPMILYYQGDLTGLNSKLCISVVGTRKSSDYGRSVAFQLGKTLSLSKVITVSGGAVGIDSAVHSGSLSIGGKTVLLLGCGHCSVYSKTAELMSSIINNNGAIISEYPPFEHGSKFTFPIRNRIISGLSRGTVVVEAGSKSGSLITVSHATEQNRDVFSVPGNASEPSFFGSNSLIRDGAYPVFCTDDILKYYVDEYEDIKRSYKENKSAIFSPLGTEHYNDTPKTKNTQKTKSTENTKIITSNRDNLSESEKSVYSLFNEQIISEEYLVENCSFPVSELIQIITSLEIKGYIQSRPGGKYEKL